MGFNPTGMDYEAQKGHKCYADNIIETAKAGKSIDNGLNDDDAIKNRNNALNRASQPLTLF